MFRKELHLGVPLFKIQIPGAQNNKNFFLLWKRKEFCLGPASWIILLIEQIKGFGNAVAHPASCSALSEYGSTVSCYWYPNVFN